MTVWDRMFAVRERGFDDSQPWMQRPGVAAEEFPTQLLTSIARGCCVDREQRVRPRRACRLRRDVGLRIEYRGVLGDTAARVS